MQILFVFSLLFAILVAVFAVMNSDPVTIKLLWKQYQSSQAIVILGSAAVGAIIVAFLGIFSKVKSSLKIRELQNKIKKLEKNLAELKIDDNINDEMPIIKEEAEESEAEELNEVSVIDVVENSEDEK